jgi:peptidoglycan hydrolase-like protein with peptidoglycan-binding domain
VSEELNFTPMTAESSTVPHPFAKKPKPGLWHVTGMQLAPYIQNVAHALLRKGRAKDESEAIHMAYGIVKRWAQGRGRNGKNVHPDVQAAASANIAAMDAKRMKAHMQHHTNLSNAHHTGDGTFAGNVKERERVLRNFQEMNNLPVTGIIDTDTKAALDSMNKAANEPQA